MKRITLLMGALLLTGCAPAALRAQPNALLSVVAQPATLPVKAVTGDEVYREPGPGALLVRTDRPAFITALVQVPFGPVTVVPVGAVAAGESVSVPLPATLGYTQVFTVASLQPLNLTAAQGLRSLNEAAKVVEVQASTLPAGSYTVTSTTYRVARFGTLEVTSNVLGAAVRLNDRFVGRTPLAIPDVPEGSVDISVQHPDFGVFTRHVNVEANTVTSVRATLRRAIGTLAVVSATPSNVLVNGQMVGVTPIRVPVRAGMVSVSVIPTNSAIAGATVTAEVLPEQSTTVQCSVVNNALDCSD